MRGSICFIDEATVKKYPRDRWGETHDFWGTFTWLTINIYIFNVLVVPFYR